VCAVLGALVRCSFTRALPLGSLQSDACGWRSSGHVPAAADRADPGERGRHRGGSGEEKAWRRLCVGQIMVSNTPCRWVRLLCISSWSMVRWRTFDRLRYEGEAWDFGQITAVEPAARATTCPGGGGSWDARTAWSIRFSASDMSCFCPACCMLFPQNNPVWKWLDAGLFAGDGLQQQEHFARVVELDAGHLDATMRLGGCQQRLHRHHEVRHRVGFDLHGAELFLNGMVQKRTPRIEFMRHQRPE